MTDEIDGFKTVSDPSVIETSEFILFPVEETNIKISEYPNYSYEALFTYDDNAVGVVEGKTILDAPKARIYKKEEFGIFYCVSRDRIRFYQES